MRRLVPHSPILDAVFAHAEKHPDKIALVSATGSEISYSDLVYLIRITAAELVDAGLKEGDKIMLSAQNEAEFVFLYFAAHLLGIINIVVDAKNNNNSLEYIASKTNPSLAIGFHLDGYKSLGYEDFKGREDLGLDYGNGNLSSDATADIMFTSGTTGKPKGVVLSHSNIFSSASNINKFIGNGVEDIEFLGLPLCHSFGLGRLRCNMLMGATVVLHNGFANLKSVYDIFERYKVTGFGMVPAIWAYMKRFSGERIGKYANSLKYIEIGSSAMSVEDKKLLCRLLPETRICMHYGLTEASRSVFMELHEYQHKLMSIGRPVTDEVEVLICDENGNQVPCMQEGEIWIKGDMVVSAYLDTSINEDAFKQGYFVTGDWGYKDYDGDLYLLSRKKELINVGGKKVSPAEIETALEEIGVVESICIPVPDPEKILGEVPKVLIVRDKCNLSVGQIKNLLKDRLESYKLPRVYEFVDDIPKTSVGKKKRIQ